MSLLSPIFRQLHLQSRPYLWYSLDVPTARINLCSSTRPWAHFCTSRTVRLKTRLISLPRRCIRTLLESHLEPTCQLQWTIDDNRHIWQYIRRQTEAVFFLAHFSTTDCTGWPYEIEVNRLTIQKRSNFFSRYILYLLPLPMLLRFGLASIGRRTYTRTSNLGIRSSLDKQKLLPWALP